MKAGGGPCPSVGKKYYNNKRTFFQFISNNIRFHYSMIANVLKKYFTEKSHFVQQSIWNLRNFKVVRKEINFAFYIIITLHRARDTKRRERHYGVASINQTLDKGFGVMAGLLHVLSTSFWSIFTCSLL